MSVVDFAELKNSMAGCDCKSRLTVLALLSSVVFFNLSATRASLGVTLLSMVSRQEDFSQECGQTSININGRISNFVNGSDGLSPHMRAAVLASFFYGYIVGQFPALFLVVRFGGKWTVAAAAAGDGVMSVLTPLAVQLGFGVLLAVRVLQGILQSLAYPGITSLWQEWSPPRQHKRVEWMDLGSTSGGLAFSLALTGVLSAYGFSDGWPSYFYLHGSAALAAALIWMILAPEDRPPASAVTTAEEPAPFKFSRASQKVFPIPWSKLLSSRAVWALLVAATCDSWCYYVFLLCLPAFIEAVVTANMLEVGFVAALPFAAQWVFGLIILVIVKKLRSNSVVKTVVVRKVATCTGFILAAGCLIGLSLVKCTPPASISLMVLTLCCSSITAAGYRVNHTDIVPRHAGALVLFIKSVSALSAIAAPHAVGEIVSFETKQASGRWHIVFFVTAGIYIMGALLYTIMAAGEVEAWASEADALPLEVALRDDAQADRAVADSNVVDCPGVIALKPLLADA